MDHLKTWKVNKGTTLIETLAAFTILAAILAILFHIVDFSDTLRMQAVDSAHLNQMFLREIYKNDESIDTEFVEIGQFDTRADNGQIMTFWLTLDKDKTVEENYLHDEGKDYFYLDNLAATSYSCKDQLIEDEELPRPVIMKFRYLKPAEPVTP